MKILLTNDDGIRGEGLRYLAEWSRKLGNVTVVAPKYEQSGRSQGIVIDRAYEVIESDEFSDLGVRAFSVDASPADCIRYTIDRIGDDYDIVFSGINNGFNLGHDIAYSGTCGAAFEANYAGIKAVSFSAKKGTLKESFAHIDEIWGRINEIFSESDWHMLNVNITAENKGLLVTEQGKTFFRDHFIESGENMYRAQVYITRDVNGPLDLRYDTDAVLAGYSSVSPLCVYRTDAKLISKTSASADNK